jgi:hypothetical protein
MRLEKVRQGFGRESALPEHDMQLITKDGRLDHARRGQ